MPDTIIDPGAVMIHLEYTETTLTAVMSACWLPSLFIFTFLTAFCQIAIRCVRCLETSRYLARVSERSSQMRENSQSAQCVKSGEVPKAPS